MSLTSQNSTEKRQELRRNVGLLDKTIAGPIASLWATSLHQSSSGSSGSKPGRKSDSGALTPVRSRFCTTKTEDAVDGGCFVPCVLEEWFRPIAQQHSKFGNPAKLQFRYSAH